MSFRMCKWAVTDGKHLLKVSFPAVLSAEIPEPRSPVFIRAAISQPSRLPQGQSRLWGPVWSPSEDFRARPVPVPTPWKREILAPG